MKYQIRRVLLLISLLSALNSLNTINAETIPEQPSVVSVSNKQLVVQHRRHDGTLRKGVNYVMKGVAWNAARSWPVTTDPPSAPFENDNRSRMWDIAKHDFPRITEAGFNTIRVYTDLGIDDPEENLIFRENQGWPAALEGMPMIGQLGPEAVAKGLALLDEAYRNGLKVIMVADGFNGNLEFTKRVVTLYKDHPAVLLWMIGNEFNFATGDNDSNRYMFRFPFFFNDSVEIDSACEQAQIVAQWIQDNDPNHPVAVCLAEPSIPSYEEYRVGLDHMSAVDLVGLNIYRGRTFKQIFKEWADEQYIGSDLPIFFSEYGVDSWHYVENETGQRQPDLEFEDFEAQREGISWQWSEIHQHLASTHPENFLIGSCIFEWVDEWWKLERSNPTIRDVTPGFPINLGFPPETDLYPDGSMHEEVWGINSQDNSTLSPIVFFSDVGLIAENDQHSEKQAWDIVTWGFPARGTLIAQADYLQPGQVRTADNFVEVGYTGGNSMGDLIPEGHRTLYVEVSDTNFGGGWGILRTASDPFDLSLYSNGNLTFWIKIQRSDGSPIGNQDKEFFIKFEDIHRVNNAVFIWLDEIERIHNFNPLSTDWQEVSIPISTLIDGHIFRTDPATPTITNQANLDLSKMRMPFSITTGPIPAGSPNYQIWIDHVRWSTGKDIDYNRFPKPVLNDFQKTLNPLSTSKTVFAISALSNTTSNPVSAILKEDSKVLFAVPQITHWGPILVAVFDARNGNIREWRSIDSETALDTFIDPYTHSGEEVILAFAVNQSAPFLPDSTLLADIGSSLYNQTQPNEPWVFITHIIDGKSTVKKETRGQNNIAFETLIIANDLDKDGILDLEDMDRDNDNLTNEDEVLYGTDILDPDTDDDNNLDGFEVANQTNPRNPDDNNYTLDPGPQLVIQPEEIHFNDIETRRFLTILNEGSGTLAWSANESLSWLSLDKYSGNDFTAEGSTLTIDVDRTGLSFGKQEGLIEIQAGGQIRQIPVSLNISSKMVISPQALTVYQPNPTALTSTFELTIENQGQGLLPWSIQENSDWLITDQSSGEVESGKMNTVTMNIIWSALNNSPLAAVKVVTPGNQVQVVNIRALRRNQYGLETPLQSLDTSYLGARVSNGTFGKHLETGDLNGDNFNDFIIGHNLNPTTGSTTHYLLFGKPEQDSLKSLITSATILELNTLFTSIMDINQDGFDDLIFEDGVFLRIFFGNPSFSSREEIFPEEADLSINIRSVPGIRFFASRGLAFGDFNNDGNIDILGSILKQPGTNLASLIIFGMNDWPQGNHSLSDPIFSYSKLATKNLPDYYFITGDFDNDNFDDILLGIRNLSDGAAREALLLYGKNTWEQEEDADTTSEARFVQVDQLQPSISRGPVTGFVNGDNYRDIIFGNQLVLGSATRFQGNISVDSTHQSEFEGTLGWIVRDLTGNKMDDIIILTPLGELLIFPGRNTWDNFYSSDQATSSLIPDKLGHPLTTFINSADFHGDGINDLVIGKPNNDEVLTSAGQVYLMLNNPFLLSQKELIFKQEDGTAKDFFIKNIQLDSSNLSWSAHSDASWISQISPSSGNVSIDNSDVIHVQVNRSGLADGIHQGKLMVNSGSIVKEILVTLHVGKVQPSKPILEVHPEHILIDNNEGTFTIKNIGNGNIPWSLHEDEPWITNVSPSLGSTGTLDTTITVFTDPIPGNHPLTSKITIATPTFQKEIFVTQKPQENGPHLPAPWIGKDIGHTRKPGIATYKDSTFTLQSAGTRIGAWSDRFYYVCQPLHGDGEIIARLDEFNPFSLFGKAGLMIRENESKGSKNVAILFNPFFGVLHQYRKYDYSFTRTQIFHSYFDCLSNFQKQDSNTFLNSHSEPIFQNPSFHRFNASPRHRTQNPIWLKLRRQGNLFESWFSFDGQNWYAWKNKSFPMKENIIIGLAVSKSPFKRKFQKAVFSNVFVTS